MNKLNRISNLVLDVAIELMSDGNVTTNLDIKNHLIEYYSQYKWSQRLISGIMEAISLNHLLDTDEKELRIVDNGTYREFSLDYIKSYTTIDLRDVILSHAGKRMQITWSTIGNSFRDYTGTVTDTLDGSGHIKFYTDSGVKTVIVSGLESVAVDGNLYQVS